MLLMVDKRLLIVTGVLVAGAAAVMLKDLATTPKTDPRVAKPLLEPTAAVGVDRVDLSQGESKLVLVRGTDDVWRLGDAAKGFPADPGKVVRLFDELSRINVQSVVATKTTDLAEFGLATPVELTLADKDKAVLALALGDSRKSGGQYVGLKSDGKSGDTTVYLVSMKVGASADADAWELKQLLDVPQEQVKTVAFRPTGGKKPAVLSRQAAADPLKLQDLPEGQKEAPSVNSLAGSFTDISFSKRYDPTNQEAVSALASASTTQIETFDGRTYDVVVGSVGAEAKKKYFMRVKATTTDAASADAKAKAQALNDLMTLSAFEVPAHVGQRFERGFADFVEAPAAPAKG
jgi:hypothetical protein